MPIYEYRCEACAKEFETMRPLSEAANPAQCPDCGAPAQKLPSVFASKADYTIKVPRSPAFRGNRPAPAGPAAGSTPATG
jgi:putative FmdB family regulatory protein